MSNRRMIYSDTFEDEFIGFVERDMRLLWIGLIVAVADDQGRMLDNATLIRSKVFPYDKDISDEQINVWLDVLAERGKIVRYGNGIRVMQIVKWWDYQSPSWAAESKYPPPKDWTDRVKVNIGQRKVKMQNWKLDGGFPKDSNFEIIDLNTKRKTKTNGDTPEEFIKSWDKKKG